MSNKQSKFAKDMEKRTEIKTEKRGRSIGAQILKLSNIGWTTFKKIDNKMENFTKKRNLFKK